MAYAFENLRPQIDIVARMLNGLRASIIKKINENNIKR